MDVREAHMVSLEMNSTDWYNFIVQFTSAILAGSLNTILPRI